MLVNGMYANSNLLVYCAVESFSVTRMDEPANRFNIHTAFLRFEPKYSIGLVGPDDLACLKIPIPIADMGDTLSLFKSCFAFLKAPGQCLAFFLGLFAFSNVCNYADVLEIARVVPSGMRDHMDVSDGAIWQQNLMLDIQVHAVLRGMISKQLHTVEILGVNSVEYQIERRIRFSCEA